MKPSLIIAILLTSLTLFILADSSSATARGLAIEEGCGPEHQNQTCGYPYPCCSTNGHCGDTVYYCAPGNCLPEFGTCWDNVPPPPPPETPSPEQSLVHIVEEGCGPEHQNQTCGYPYPCCSTNGHCGDTVYYCAPGNCLSEFGTCWDNVPPPPPPETPSPEQSPVHIVEEGCGPEHQNQTCGYPYPCCSTNGHCGDTVYYCAPGNCLSEFGTCWDNVPPPPPPETPSPEQSPVHIVEEGCGPEHQNQTCGYPYPCCSTNGHCGDTVYYCAPGNCLSEFGTCWDNVPPPPPPETPSPEQSLVHIVEEGCGPEHQNQTCGYPYPCCSIHGHCGDTVYYCAPGNCLSEFGTCWDNVPPPPPESNRVPEESLVRNVFDKIELLIQF